MREAFVKRETKETRIEIRINLDGKGEYDIETGIGFFNHMLEGFAKHGLFDLYVRCEGDLEVDSHHTIEDVGICLGQAIKEALGDKKSIKRFGNMMLPMDETLVLCAVDLSGRAYLVYELNFTVPKIGGLDTEMIKDFFYSLSVSAGMNLHIRQLYGSNNHHIAEGAFKAFAKALDMATLPDGRMDGVWSTKGVL